MHAQVGIDSTLSLYALLARSLVSCHYQDAAQDQSPPQASCTPRSANSCNKVDASDVRASRRLVCTVARERRTFSLRDLCQWRSPVVGECHRPNLLSENVNRSRDQVHTSCVTPAYASFAAQVRAVYLPQFRTFFHGLAHGAQPTGVIVCAGEYDGTPCAQGEGGGPCQWRRSCPEQMLGLELDHEHEVALILDMWAKARQAAWAPGAPAPPWDAGIDPVCLCHALFSVVPHPRLGAPYIVPRCSSQKSCAPPLSPSQWSNRTLYPPPVLEYSSTSRYRPSAAKLDRPSVGWSVARRSPVQSINTPARNTAR